MLVECKGRPNGAKSIKLNGKTKAEKQQAGQALKARNLCN